MDGFKNIEIKNFRGIDHLKIDDFSRVNVFLGQNGSGKSSILEAILMLSGMSNPGLPQNINLLRSRGVVGQYLDETLCRLNEMLEENPDYQQEMRLYTIANTQKNGYQAYKYTYEGLSGACENNIEVRSIVIN